MVTSRIPWAFQDLVHELDRLTRESGWAFDGPSLTSEHRNTGLQVREDSAALALDLPGVDESDLNIELEENLLKVHAVRNDLHEDEEEVVLRERSYGEFSRTYTLPWPVQQEEVDARFQQGVLTLRLKRAPESAPRRIEVKSS